MPRRVLAAWIGNNDLRAMANSLPSSEQQSLKSQHSLSPDPDSVGPISALVSKERFDEIHLLSNYDARWNKHFVEWLGQDAKVRRVTLADPTDYEKILRIADDFLQSLDVSRSSGRELCIHLSPGTPAMAAIWVLLGRSRYAATFYQTHRGQVRLTTVPIDLAFEALREVDAQLQYLASAPPSELTGFKGIVGDAPQIREAAGRAHRAAVRDVSVLLVGESGTGKELFADAIHKASRRKDKPYRAVNCAAFPRDLLDAELFGHEKGAFTGAEKQRKGLFEQADGGTLFLDEIGECSLETQVRLLRVLEPIHGKGPCIRRFQRVGGTETIETDVRVIAATNRDLMAAIRDYAFREDLYYRLAVMVVRLPPLRQRRPDIPKLVEELLRQVNESFRMGEAGYQDKSLSTGAMDFVRRHNWPGNIRQLRNALIQAAVLAEGAKIERQHLADAIAELPSRTADSLDLPLGGDFSLTEHLNSIQRQYLERAMQEAGGVKTKAAKLLGIENYQTLDAQLKRLKVKA